jgi:tetratricopeptide (TPR) repeat protein
VATESPRITELRRRVESDPSSIAFAQLAEEYRRAGNYEAAERCCRTGLARHPAYLSARVTLGRTLIELDKLEEAELELQHVLTAAPDNLAALRGIADIQQRLGRLDAALDYYRRALALSRHDPELEELVDRLDRTVSPPPAAVTTTDAPLDFDALLDSLGVRNHPAPPSIEALLDSDAAPVIDPPVEEPLPAVDPLLDGQFGPLEEAGNPDWMVGPLPEITAQGADEHADAAVELVDFKAGDSTDQAEITESEGVVLDELEAWLKAIRQ